MADSINENEAVFCPATLMLGEIHWQLLRAEHLMQEKAIVTRKKEGFVAVRDMYTDFGKQVGRDEINWWVFKKEPDVEELRRQTTRALEAAQKLKESSKRLGTNRTETHDDFLRILRTFAEERATEIKTIHEFVHWLTARDVLAPTILFTYRVWGSTRRFERRFNLELNESKPKSETVRALSEIVLGLVSGRLPVMVRAEYEIGSDIYERLTHEEVADDTEIKIPVKRVVLRASSMAFDACAEYFEFLRDSLRNILIDIDKFVAQRDLVNDDAFWRAFIARVMTTSTAESQLWDCKETLTLWHVDNKPQRDQAKVTFCEDIASFANTRGGILLIGVSDKRKVVGIGSGRELESRLKVAADVLEKQLEYPRRDIFHLRQIPQDYDGADKICLVIVIAQACQPVGVHDGEGHYTYPVRRETGLTRVARDEILTPKMHMKSDNYDFLADLYQFVRGNKTDE